MPMPLVLRKFPAIYTISGPGMLTFQAQHILGSQRFWNHTSWALPSGPQCGENDTVEKECENVCKFLHSPTHTTAHVWLMRVCANRQGHEKVARPDHDPRNLKSFQPRHLFPSNTALLSPGVANTEAIDLVPSHKLARANLIWQSNFKFHHWIPSCEEDLIVTGQLYGYNESATYVDWETSWHNLASLHWGGCTT